jgi:hypothetical protein
VPAHLRRAGTIYAAFLRIKIELGSPLIDYHYLCHFPMSTPCDLQSGPWSIGTPLEYAKLERKHPAFFHQQEPKCFCCGTHKENSIQWVLGCRECHPWLHNLHVEVSGNVDDVRYNRIRPLDYEVAFFQGDRELGHYTVPKLGGTLTKTYGGMTVTLSLRASGDGYVLTAFINEQK